MRDDVASYCMKGFAADADAMRAAGGSRVSIVALLPDGVRRSPAHARAFAELPRRDRFLWGFYFHLLLGHALHETGRAGRFPGAGDGPLELGGILATKQVNLHPSLLLLVAASFHVAPGLEDRATAEFSATTRWYARTVERMLRDDAYASLELRSALSSGTAPLDQPTTLEPYHVGPILPGPYERWLAIANAAMNALRA